METDSNGKSFRVVLHLCPPEHTDTADLRAYVRVSGLNSVNVDPGRGHRAHVLDFDAVWGEGASLREIYESTAKPLVEDVLRGYNGCVIVYRPHSSVDPHSVQFRGIISRAADHIFNSPESSHCRVRVSFYHISNEKIYDLLEAKFSEVCRIHDMEEVVLLEGLREVEVKSVQQLLQVYRHGTTHRNAGASKGDFASKSHMVFSIIIINTRGQSGKGILTASKLTLVDLASSGKVRCSTTFQEVRRSFSVAPENPQEAKTLKRSLTIFRNVIFSLSDVSCQHIPYRESKLTRALRDCLGGNCRTCLLVTMTTQSSSVTEAMSCLQFAARAMKCPSRPIHPSQLFYTTAQVQSMWTTERSGVPLARTQTFPPVTADKRSQACLPPILATSGLLTKPKPRSSLEGAESQSFLPQLEKLSPTEPYGCYGLGSQKTGKKSRAVDVCVLKGVVPLAHCLSSNVLPSSSSSSSSLCSSLSPVTECPNCKQERKIREEYDKFIVQVKRDRDSLSQRVTELEKELKKSGGKERECGRVDEVRREERIRGGEGRESRNEERDSRGEGKEIRREERESISKEMATERKETETDKDDVRKFREMEKEENLKRTQENTMGGEERECEKEVIQMTTEWKKTETEKEEKVSGNIEPEIQETSNRRQKKEIVGDCGEKEKESRGQDKGNEGKEQESGGEEKHNEGKERESRDRKKESNRKERGSERKARNGVKEKKSGGIERERGKGNGGEPVRENDSRRKESSSHKENSAEESLLYELNRMREEYDGLRKTAALCITQLQKEKAELISHIDNSKTCYEKVCLENAELKARLEDNIRPCTGCRSNLDTHSPQTHRDTQTSHTHTVTTSTEMLLMSHCISHQCTTALPQGSKCCLNMCSGFPESSECGFGERPSEQNSHTCNCDLTHHKPNLYKQLQREHSLLLDVMLVLYKREWFLQDAMPYVRRTLRKCGLTLEHTD
ncbi:kinesin-like protein KIF3C [Hoplias malabaricus]|uniref:kinesin-like protein KIF3C n=1 Tax=Hoplias malabaricus TaxID=27720 RepID=UPI0034624A69